MISVLTRLKVKINETYSNTDFRTCDFYWKLLWGVVGQYGNSTCKRLVKTNFQCCNRSSSKNIPTFKIKFLITTDSRIHNLRVEIMLSFQFNFIQVKTTVLLQKQILFRRYISKMQFLMMINFLIKSMFLSNSLIFFSRLLSFFLCFPDFF